MPVDRGTRGRDAAPVVPRPATRPVRPDDRASRPTPQTTAPVRPDDRADRSLPPAAMPASPPVTALQKHGVQLTVTELNDRVHAIVDSHERARGARPTAGLVLDVLRSQVTPDLLDSLFDLPRTRRQARARAALNEVGGGDFTGPRPEEGALRAQEPFAYGAPDPVDLETARNYPNLSQAEKRAFLVSMEGRTLGEKRQLLVAAGRLPEGVGHETVVLSAGTGAEVVAEFVLKSGLQLFGGLLLGPPTLVFEEAKAAKESVEQRSLRPLGEANVELAKAVASGVKEDFTDPLANPGFLALDLLGIASLGAGFAARGAAVTKATGAKAATKALIKRPLPGTTTLRKGDVEVQALNTENAAMRPLQRAVRSIRQKKADARHSPPADAGVLLETSFGRFWKQHFSFERKIGRELAREDRLTVQLRDSTRKDLERVTGWSQHVGAVQAKLPKRARRGLTRGEQMALFIESLDDAAPARTLREHHESMAFGGIGDTAAHVQKLRDIQMAEQVLRSPEKQSPRFRKALELTQQAVAEMEWIKVNELGLDARTAVGRVALAGEVLRTGKALPEVAKIERELATLDNKIAATKTEDLGGLPAERDALVAKRDAAIAERAVPRERDTSFYVPTVTPLRTRKLAQNPFRGMRFGQYGGARKRARELVPELGHEFTGKALIVGDYRIDTTRLVGEAVGRTVRGALVLEQYHRHLKAATKTPRTEFDRPIRKPDQASIPNKLREILNKTDEGELTAEQAGHLSKADWDATIKELYPGTRNERTGDWLPDDGAEVLWVDERILDPQAFRQPLPTAVVKGLQTMNEPFRTATLYLRPAYLMNLLGSSGMAAIFEGLLAPPNVYRAIRAKHFYGDANANWLRELVGAGRTTSYVDEALSSRASRFAATKWNRITDQDLRVSALLYYLRRAEVKTPEQMTKLREAARQGDREAFTTLNEAVARAKKSAVEFDNQTWIEQNLLRHMIFVYPWQRGATVWSLRTLIERPVKADVLAQLGADTADELDDFLSKAPDWFKRAGYLPWNWDGEGNPTVLLPSSLNTWSGLGAVMHGDPSDFGGPLTEFAVRGYTGQDEFGNDYPDQNWARWAWAALDITTQLPQVRAQQRAGRKDEALPPIDPADRETLIRRRNAALEQAVLSPGWLWGYGSLITGGMTPRTANRMAIEARYYHDAPYEVKHAANRNLVMAGLKLQAGLLGTSVPRDVTRLVGVHFDKDLAEHVVEQEKGRDLTPAERDLVQLDFYQAKGYVSEKEADKLRAASAKLDTAEEHERFRTSLFRDYVDRDGQLRRWDSDVRQVAALSNPSIVQRRVDALARDGLLNTTRDLKGIPKAALVEYGRAVVKFSHEVQVRQRELSQIADPEERDIAFAAFREWAEENDKPVRVAGRSLPSPARVEWARMTPERREQMQVDKAVLPWEFLSAFDKEIVGNKAEPGVAKGWTQLATYIAEYKAGLPPGERRLPAGYEDALARHVNKYVAPGFYKDWTFSREPLAVRMQALKTGQSSELKEIVGIAVSYAAYLKNDDYSATEIRDRWHDYVKTTVEPYIGTNPALGDEVDKYGADLIYNLLD